MNIIDIIQTIPIRLFYVEWPFIICSRIEVCEFILFRGSAVYWLHQVPPRLTVVLEQENKNINKNNS